MVSLGLLGLGLWRGLAHGPAGARVRAAESLFDALHSADCATLFASPAARCNRVCTIGCSLNLLPSKGGAEVD
jgi:hypothetical protein